LRLDRKTATLTAEEQQRLVELTVSAARGRAKVIAGTGSNSTAESIHRSLEARVRGADAVMLVAPYYNKPSQDGLYAHFRAVAEAVRPLPVLLYNVPARTASHLMASMVLRLAWDVENIVGIKESSGDFSNIMEILHRRPCGFKVISGDDALTYPLIMLGFKAALNRGEIRAAEQSPEGEWHVGEKGDSVRI
jgi:4-hydroxy-tetrahydrodipicolinate synthase